MGDGKILVVDDEVEIRDLILAILEDEGYEVAAATSGEGALRLLPSVRPDLILMDIMMPQMDGREALRRIRAEPEFARLPVVLMSAAFSRDQAGTTAEAFLPKPFDIDRLLETIATLLDERRGSPASA